MSMRATPEQRIVVRSKAKLLIVKAFAGTGKTTTLIEYAKARPRARILYLAYNKPIQQAAAGKFPKNVECKTTHSLAYARFGRPYADAQKLGNVRSTDIMMMMKLDAVFSKNVLETVNNFIYSADQVLGNDHVPQGVHVHRHDECLAVAKTLWSAMCALPGEHPMASKLHMTHDGYLKLYHLSKPDLSKKYDIVMLDEYQDSNPVTSDIVLSQTCPRVLVGDTHQAIYGFRKSVGGMDAAAELPGAEVCYLTSSFRFGPDIAALATALLTGFKDETRPLIGAGGALRIATKVDRSERYITICRTNASVFRAAVGFLDKKKVNFIGGVASYPFERLVDLQRLASGQVHEVQDAFFRSMGSLARLQEYVNKVKDPEIGALLSVLKEYGPSIPGLVDAIQKDAVDTEAESDVQLSTAHRCKGLEWKQVVMYPDFENFEEEGGKPRFLDTQELVEEFNLLYVTATRATHALEINDSVIRALKALGTTEYGFPEGTPESDWVDALVEGEVLDQELELREASTPTPVAPAAVAATIVEPAPALTVTVPERTVVKTSGIPLSKVAIAEDVRVAPVPEAVIVAAQKQTKPWLDRTRFQAPVDVVAAVVEPAAADTAPVRTVVVTSGIPLSKVAIADDVRIEPVSVAVIMAAAKQTKPWLDRTRFLAPVDVVVTSGIPLSKVAIADDVRIEPVSVAVIMAAAKQLKPWRDRTRFLAPVAVVAAVVEPAPAFTVAVFVRTVVETGCNPLAKVAIADDVRIEPVSGAVIVAAQKQLKPWLDRTRFLGT